LKKIIHLLVNYLNHKLNNIEIDFSKKSNFFTSNILSIKLLISTFAYLIVKFNLEYVLNLIKEIENYHYIFKEIIYLCFINIIMFEIQIKTIHNINDYELA
jgi:hypothetical protein